MCTLYLGFIEDSRKYSYGKGKSILHPDISCRVAIVVDKIDRSTFNDAGLRLLSYYNSSKALERYHLEEYILPEIGVVDYNILLNY